MLEAIKNRYTYLFDLTRRSIYPLEKTLNKPIPEEEIGFITILYGGWLRREKQMDQAAANPRAIFVCENGVAISSYIYLELKDLLPQLDFGGVYSVREFRNQKIECDLIFSTVPLEVPVKTFVLQPMMSEPEKQSFAHQVQMYLAGFNLQVNEVDDYMDAVSYTHLCETGDSSGAKSGAESPLGVEGLDQFCGRGSLFYPDDARFTGICAECGEFAGDRRISADCDGRADR